MKPAICLETIYPDLDPTYKITKIAEFGFNNMEFWGWHDKDVLNVISACLEGNIRVVNFSGHQQGSLVAAETHDLMLSDLKKAVSIANQIDCPTLMLLTNELGKGGVAKNPYSEIPPDDKYQNVRIGLEKALRITPSKISIVLEPFNIRVDHPDYSLSDMETAISLIQVIGHPQLKVLCDLYHFGLMGTDLNALITKYIDYIGHIHIADFPGRHEPGTGSADWYALLSLLREKEYSGYVGFEYSPLNTPEESLENIRALWDRVME